MLQCPSCRSVFHVDPRHPSGGTWEPADQRVPEASHKYCPRCEARLAAHLAGLADSVLQSEQPPAEPEATSQKRSRLPLAVGLGLLTAAVIVCGLFLRARRQAASRAARDEAAASAQQPRRTKKRSTPVHWPAVVPLERGGASPAPAKPGPVAAEREAVAETAEVEEPTEAGEVEQARVTAEKPDTGKKGSSSTESRPGVTGISFASGRTYSAPSYSSAPEGEEPPAEQPEEYQSIVVGAEGPEGGFQIELPAEPEAAPEPQPDEEVVAAPDESAPVP